MTFVVANLHGDHTGFQKLLQTRQFKDSDVLYVLGDSVDFGGLLGTAPIMDVSPYSCKDFILRGGHIPAPMHSLKN